MRSPAHALWGILVLVPATTYPQEPLAVSRSIVKISAQHFAHYSLKTGFECFNKNHSNSFLLFVTGKLATRTDEPDYWSGYSGVAAELQFRKYVSATDTMLLPVNSSSGNMLAR